MNDIPRILFVSKLKNQVGGDFPGGPVVKSPHASAGTQVRSLVREDPTRAGAAKTMRCSD